MADDVAEKIKKAAQVKGVTITELHRVVSAFRGYVQGESGETREITVEVLDSGEDGMYRYNVEARDADERDRLATGNGAPDLDVALSIVHWGNLLKE